MNDIKEAAKYIKEYIKNNPGIKDLAPMVESCRILDRQYISQAIMGMQPWKYMSYIPDYSFFQCRDITNIVLPDSVTSIGEHAFYGCWGLTSITIPDSVTSIGGRAFCGCKEISSVSIGKGVTEVDTEAFFLCFGICTISIHNPKTYFGKSSIDTTNLTDINYMGTCDECRRYLNLDAFDGDGEITIHCSDGTLWAKYFPELEEYRITP